MAENQCVSHQAHATMLDNDKTRLDSHERELDRIVIAIERLTVIQETTEKRLAALERGVATIKEAPARRWEQLTMYAAMAIVGGLIGFLLTNFGIGS